MKECKVKWFDRDQNDLIKIKESVKKMKYLNQSNLIGKKRRKKNKQGRIIDYIFFIIS